MTVVPPEGTGATRRALIALASAVVVSGAYLALRPSTESGPTNVAPEASTSKMPSASPSNAPPRGCSESEQNLPQMPLAWDQPFSQPRTRLFAQSGDALVRFEIGSQPELIRREGSKESEAMGFPLRGVSAITSDAEGSTWLVGNVEGRAEIGSGHSLGGGGGRDAILVRLAPNGKVQSAASFGGSGDDRALHAAPGPEGGVALSAVYEGDLTLGQPLPRAAQSRRLVARFDSRARALWSRALEEDVSQVLAFATNTQGAVAAVVLARTKVGEEVRIVRFEPDGKGPLTRIWKLDPNVSGCVGILCASSQHFAPTFGAIEPERAALALDAQGAMVVSLDHGTSTRPSTKHTYVANLESSGEVTWFRRFPRAGISESWTSLVGTGDAILSGAFFIQSQHASAIQLSPQGCMKAVVNYPGLSTFSDVRFAQIRSGTLSMVVAGIASEASTSDRWLGFRLK